MATERIENLNLSRPSRVNLSVRKAFSNLTKLRNNDARKQPSQEEISTHTYCTQQRHKSGLLVCLPLTRVSSNFNSHSLLQPTPIISYSFSSQSTPTMFRTLIRRAHVHKPGFRFPDRRSPKGISLPSFPSFHLNSH